ncbi:MAG: RNA-binding S4 domain-containing protein [Kineosporiaceae bacterium]
MSATPRRPQRPAAARPTAARRGFAPRRPVVPAVPEVAVTGEGIRLGQFVKLAGLADGHDTGGEVKLLIAAGEVLVNGEVETRRGRQLVKGDVVAVGASSARVG